MFILNLDPILKECPLVVGDLKKLYNDGYELPLNGGIINLKTTPNIFKFVAFTDNFAFLAYQQTQLKTPQFLDVLILERVENDNSLSELRILDFPNPTQVLGGLKIGLGQKDYLGIDGLYIKTNLLNKLLKAIDSLIEYVATGGNTDAHTGSDLFVRPGTHRIIYIN